MTPAAGGRCLTKLRPADSWAVVWPRWSCGAPLVAAAAIAEPVLPLLLLLQAEKLEGMLKKKGQSIDKVR